MLFTKTETLNSILLEKKKFIFPSLLFLYKEKFCSISKKKVNQVLSSLLLKEEGSFKLFLLNLKKLKNKDQKKLFLSKLFFNKGKNFQKFSHFFMGKVDNPSPTCKNDPSSLVLGRIKQAAGLGVGRNANEEFE